MKVPPHIRESYKGSAFTVERMAEAAGGLRGGQSVAVRMFTEEIVRHVTPRDQLSELAAIYYAFLRGYGYLHDPVRVELVKDPERQVAELAEHGMLRGDCDDATLMLGTAPQTIGIRTFFERMGWKGHFTHIVAGGIDQFRRQIILDPVADRRTGKALRTANVFAHRALGDAEMPQGNPNQINQMQATLDARAHALRTSPAGNSAEFGRRMSQLVQAIGNADAMITKGRAHWGLTEPQWNRFLESRRRAMYSHDAEARRVQRNNGTPPGAHPSAPATVADGSPSGGKPPASSGGGSAPRRPQQPPVAPTDDILVPPAPSRGFLDRAREFVGTPMGKVSVAAAAYWGYQKYVQK